MTADHHARVIVLTAEITSAWLRNHPFGRDDVPGLIIDVRKTLIGLEGAAEIPAIRAASGFDPDRSIHDGFLVCAECGARSVYLRRHLRERHGLMPETYRIKWNLPGDYPMAPPGYAKSRSELAR